MTELDHARYLLGFDRIELGVSSSGDWSVYYRYPCRYLSRETFECTVHETAKQPSICRHYNPYSCWYRRSLRSPISPDFLRVDRPPCRYLKDSRCTIFGQPERPLICRYYDAHSCAYKPQFGTPRPEGFVRVRLEQFHQFAGCFSFDADGRVLEAPTSAQVREAIEESWRQERAGATGA